MNRVFKKELIDEDEILFNEMTDASVTTDDNVLAEVFDYKNYFIIF